MPPLLLLHGFLSAPAAWDAVRDRLPPELEVHTLPLSGHGGAPVVSSWDDEIARLSLEIARCTGGRPAHLIGYSLGGRLALGLLARRAELFGRATLISARNGLSDEAERALRREADAAWARRLREEGLNTFLDAWEAQPLFATQGRLSEDQRDSWRRLRAAGDPRTLAVGLGPLSLGRMPDYKPDLSLLGLPVTVLAGALDPKFCALGAQLAALLPRGKLVIVPDAGHNLPLEAPVALAREITRSHDEPFD